jgi:hypothetical protein
MALGMAATLEVESLDTVAFNGPPIGGSADDQDHFGHALLLGAEREDAGAKRRERAGAPPALV